MSRIDQLTLQAHDQQIQPTDWIESPTGTDYALCPFDLHYATHTFSIHGRPYKNWQKGDMTDTDMYKYPLHSDFMFRLVFLDEKTNKYIPLHENWVKKINVLSFTTMSPCVNGNGNSTAVIPYPLKQEYSLFNPPKPPIGTLTTFQKAQMPGSKINIQDIFAEADATDFDNLDNAIDGISKYLPLEIQKSAINRWNFKKIFLEINRAWYKPEYHPSVITIISLSYNILRILYDKEGTIFHSAPLFV